MGLFCWMRSETFRWSCSPSCCGCFSRGSSTGSDAAPLSSWTCASLAATNANLKYRMQEGTFREDLYYRLSVFPVRVPPLRERREDILGLANYFLEMYGKKYSRAVTLPTDICRVLEQYDWPGNVREMQNVIEYYVICSEEGNEMSLEQLARVLQFSQQDTPTAPACIRPGESPAAGRDAIRTAGQL